MKTTILKKKVTINAVWMSAEKIGLMLSSLLISIAAARLLGASNFGDLSYILALSSFIVPISSLGLNSVIVQSHSKDGYELSVLYSTSFLLRSVAAAVVVSITCLIIMESELEPEVKDSAIYLAITYLLSGAQVAIYFHQANENNQALIKPRLVLIFAFCAIKLWVLEHYHDLSRLLIAAAAESASYFLLYSATLYKNKIKLSIACYSQKCAGVLLKRSVWLFFSGIAAIIYLKVDQIMLKSLSGSDAVAKYAVAARISEVWYFFPEAFMAAAFPRLLKKNAAELEALTAKLLRVITLIAVVLTIGIVVSAEFLITVFYGAEYQGSYKVLQLHIIALIFVFSRAVVSKWLVLNGLYHFSLISHGAGAVVNVLMNLYLIPKYGAIGAALATVFSYAFASFFVFGISKSTRKVFFLQFRAYREFWLELGSFRRFLDKP